MIRQNRWTAFTIIVVLITAAYLSLARDENAQPVDYLDLMSQIYELVRTTYLEETDPMILAEGAVDGMLLKTSPYSYLYAVSGKTDLCPEQGPVDAGLIVGFQDELIEIIDVFPGSAGHSKGLMPGDKILRIKDQVAPVLSLLRAQRLLSGSSGEKIEVIVQHYQSKIFEEITLELVEYPHEAPMESSVMDGILFLRFPWKIDDTNVQSILDDLQKLREQMHNGVIIDLRHVHSGDSGAGLRLADWFIEDGKTMGFWCANDPKDNEPITAGDSSSTLFPVVVVIDNTTAGPGESFGGAMQAARRAFLTGQTTFGKSIRYKTIPLNSDFIMYVAAMQYCNQQSPDLKTKKISPDYPVVLPCPENVEPFYQTALNVLQYSRTESNVTLH